ncbi:MAG: hypothetical protein ACKO4U_10555, partial [Caldilinea sp.]
EKAAGEKTLLKQVVKKEGFYDKIVANALLWRRGGVAVGWLQAGHKAGERSWNCQPGLRELRGSGWHAGNSPGGGG